MPEQNGTLNRFGRGYRHGQLGFADLIKLCGDGVPIQGRLPQRYRRQPIQEQQGLNGDGAPLRQRRRRARRRGPARLGFADNKVVKLKRASSGAQCVGCSQDELRGGLGAGSHRMTAVGLSCGANSKFQAAVLMSSIAFHAAAIGNSLAEHSCHQVGRTKQRARCPESIGPTVSGSYPGRKVVPARPLLKAGSRIVASLWASSCA